jgi:carbon storage regulator CsrA
METTIDLTISRKPGEEILIDAGAVRVRVRVVSVEGRRVKVAVTAPPEVLVSRGEAPKGATDVDEGSGQGVQ